MAKTIHPDDLKKFAGLWFEAGAQRMLSHSHTSDLEDEDELKDVSADLEDYFNEAYDLWRKDE